ncbi:hypothetical protein IE81DRAFT_170185 [Ceraceosorus guamensis]|uniref:Uncharacterized protein n=1 Tax=Ceraceosorus guamensis TaxID=1522189 RepID=A0A316VXL8_9BASI|nr:hypothetical protein IE81DRAFT_170185 [Ceraceosorus guamensis]PWN41638.1 hypothetical protein IE81DRAFT_170185 [Ceraceosorus guamensis]
MQREVCTRPGVDWHCSSGALHPLDYIALLGYVHLLAKQGNTSVSILSGGLSTGQVRGSNDISLRSTTKPRHHSRLKCPAAAAVSYSVSSHPEETLLSSRIEHKSGTASATTCTRPALLRPRPASCSVHVIREHSRFHWIRRAAHYSVGLLCHCYKRFWMERPGHLGALISVRLSASLGPFRSASSSCLR